MQLLAFLAVLILAGCAQSSGIMPLGPDTYTVSVHAAPARGGVPGAKKIALTDADAHCRGLGKQMLVSNLTSGAPQHLPGGTVDITFLCLEENDPQLKRPVFETAPDLVIEIR